MRVLLVHEYYRSGSPSGEDRVFDNERKLLEDGGVHVETLSFNNDDIGKRNGISLVKTALGTPWSLWGAGKVKKAISRMNPDIVHFHNTFPAFSPSVIWQAKEMGVSTVQTFHNFRSICANAILMKGSKICEKCMGSYPWHAIAGRCYRDSLLATVPLSASIALHRFLGTWSKKVDRFIVLSEFNKKKFMEAGLKEERLCVKPNYLRELRLRDAKKDGSWVFVGRLSREKGVHILPEVWKRLGEKAPRLNIVGDGPYMKDLKQDIEEADLGGKVLLHGKCDPSMVQMFLGKAELMVMPSFCYEGFPVVVAESYRQGVAVAASGIGTLSTLVKKGETGTLFSPGDIEGMVSELKKAIDHPEQLYEMGKNARREYENLYNPETNLKRLTGIYREAMTHNSGTIKTGR